MTRRPAESPEALKRTWLAMRVTGRYSRWLGGYFANRFWFTPWVVDNTERSKARHARWLKGVEDISIPHPGGPLRGFAMGSGPTVLLVHGWGERAATMGALARPLVDGGYRVVGVDLPAHGDSPGRRTDIPKEAEAVRATIAYLGDVYGVIAHSMGGAVAAYALADGPHIERLVMIGSAVRLEHAIETFTKMAQVPPRAALGLRQRIERKYGSDVWNNFAVDRSAEAIGLAPLIVHDEHDEQIPFADGEMLAAAWPGSRFMSTSGLGHVKVMGDERVQQAILDHLKPSSDSRVGAGAGYSHNTTHSTVGG